MALARPHGNDLKKLLDCDGGKNPGVNNAGFHMLAPTVRWVVKSRDRGSSYVASEAVGL